MTSDLKKLKELDDLTVASGDPDPRGWHVEAADGTDVGHVKDLIVDTAEMKAKYLDVEVDPALTNTRKRHVLVPTASVAIGQRERNLRRISLPVPRQSIVAAACPSHITPLEPVGMWPAALRDVCSVRVIRGGSHG
jgi:hypothetical protein